MTRRVGDSAPAFFKGQQIAVPSSRVSTNASDHGVDIAVDPFAVGPSGVPRTRQRGRRDDDFVGTIPTGYKADSLCWRNDGSYGKYGNVSWEYGVECGFLKIWVH